MAQIRDIKKRIKSVNNTSKVTHAMELVAGAKMRKSQESALSSRPYTSALDEILGEVKNQAHKKGHKLLRLQDQKLPALLILITTDRGLVGGLNMNLFRLLSDPSALNTGNTDSQSNRKPENLKFVIIGKKGSSFAAKTGSDIIASFISDEKSPLELTRTLTKIAVDGYKKGEFSTVKVIYPDFQSTIKQVPAITQILPIEIEVPKGKEHLHPLDNMLFEPTPDTILEAILPHYVLTKIYQCILESKASEHSARMVAMKNATDAANDLVDDLTLTYNQARQEAITKELLDIVTAQSAFQ